MVARTVAGGVPVAQSARRSPLRLAAQGDERV